MKTIPEQIKVMDAYENGVIIEAKHRNKQGWKVSVSPVFNWEYFDYRIKPKFLYINELEEGGDSIYNVHKNRYLAECNAKILANTKGVELVKTYRVELEE